MITLRQISAPRVLAIAGLACALTASPARAEAPSVDAYAGQALVLGTPHHSHGGEHRGGHSGPAGSARESRNEPNASAGSGPSSGSGSSGPSSGAGSSTGSARGNSSTYVHSTNSANSVTRSGRSAATPNSGAGASSGQTGRSQGQPLTTQPADSSVPLSGSDVSLLVAGALLLLGTAFALRRTRSPNA